MIMIGHQDRTIKQDLLDLPNRFRPNVHRLQMTCENKERQKKKFYPFTLIIFTKKGNNYQKLLVWQRKINCKILGLGRV